MQADLRTPICEYFGAAVPIFGFAHSVEVVAAVTLAGGIGVFGGTRSTPGEIRQALAEISERVGDRPFGVDLVLPRGMPEHNNREDLEAAIPDEHRAFVDHLYTKYGVPRDQEPGMRTRFIRSEEVAERQLAAVLESDAQIFAIGVGSPPEAITAAKARGKSVVSLVGAPRHAERALQAGADVLVAQGSDAGGHTGEIGTFSLVPQIVEMAGAHPVIAAGGVATGRHIAAALALGAQGVWIGTAWLTTAEHGTDPVLLQKLLAARAEDTVISRSNSGKPLRMTRGAWTEEWDAPDAPAPLAMPYHDVLVGDLLGAIDRHGIEALVHSAAGQGIAWQRELSTVPEVMGRLIAEAEAVLA